MILLFPMRHDRLCDFERVDQPFPGLKVEAEDGLSLLDAAVTRFFGREAFLED